MLVLIAGITGKLGQRLGDVAISRGLSVRGLGRNPDKLSPELSRKIESFVKSDSYYDIPAIEKAVSGVDAVICAYSPEPLMDLDAHLILLRAAERAQIKIFVASSWNHDWTNIKFGDFEHYDTHLAFEQQAAITSPIRPVYVITGMFTDFLFTPYGPGMLDTSGDRPRMQYWGNGDAIKWPWSNQDDVAVWTIDILLHGDGVQAGNGGFFRVRSGENTIGELAAAYAKVFETKVDIIREGSLEDLEAEVARLRKEKGRGRYIEYLPLSSTLLGTKGLWEFSPNVTVLSDIKKSTLEEYLREVKK